MYLVSDFIIFLILLFAVLVFSSILYYRKCIAIYSEFPRVACLFYIVKSILLSKIPKDIPIQSFYFQYLIDTCKKFQTEGWCLFWGFQPYLFIYSEEAFKVFSHENTCVNKPYNFDLFKEFMMESLLTSRGNVWRKRRKMLNPVFYTPYLKDKTEMLNRNAHLLVEMLVKYNKEASSNAVKFLKICAFRNIYEFLTDLQLNADDNNPEVEIGIDCVNKGTEMLSYRIAKPWLHHKCFLFLSPKRRWITQVIHRGLQFAETILNRMKESILRNKMNYEKEIDESGRNSRRPFGQVIFEQHAKDPTFTFSDMTGELIGLLSAGYDTVSYAMMWTLFLLGHHPDAQEQAYGEVKSVIGHNNEVSYDNLENLKYLECVIKESLRIYPPVPFYARRTVRDIPCGNYTVPRGTNIILFTYMLHRDPSMFPDPEKFDPERFLKGNSDKKLTTYFFAEGARNCIGKNFAMMELKIILSHIVRNFKITSLDSREKISLSWEIILTTARPLRMSFTPRQPVL